MKHIIKIVLLSQMVVAGLYAMERPDHTVLTISGDQMVFAESEDLWREFGADQREQLRDLGVNNSSDLSLFLSGVREHQIPLACNVGSHRCAQITVLTIAAAVAAGAVDYATELMGYETHVARQARIGLAMTLGKMLLGRGINFFRRPHMD